MNEKEIVELGVVTEQTKGSNEIGGPDGGSGSSAFTEG